jgi:arylsulfatase A-like enzyme
VRDPLFNDQVHELFAALEHDADDMPWLTVTSFVNPHDIVFSGFGWQALGMPQPDADVPDVGAAPSQSDSFDGRPRAQQHFRDVWPRFLYPQPTDAAYRRFYYWLHKVVDEQIVSVLDALDRSRFAHDTIVVFTSDHGEMLGAHGGMQQKFHTAFDEAIRVPMWFSGPGIEPSTSITAPTSHVDLLPTLLSLTGVDVEVAEKALAETHVETHALVGRNHAPALQGASAGIEDGAPVYFMTEDDISAGMRSYGLFSNEPIEAIPQPSHIEAAIGRVDNRLVKITQYYDELREWREANDMAAKPDPAPSEWELYDLDTDPEERTNLADNASHATLFGQAQVMLAVERDRVRRTPSHRNRRH